MSTYWVVSISSIPTEDPESITEIIEFTDPTETTETSELFDETTTETSSTTTSGPKPICTCLSTNQNNEDQCSAKEICNPWGHCTCCDCNGCYECINEKTRKIVPKCYPVEKCQPFVLLSFDRSDE